MPTMKSLASTKSALGLSMDLTSETDSEVESPPIDEMKVVTWVEQQFTRCKSDRWQYDREWLYNLHMYFGNQYITWNSAGRSYIRTTAPRHRVRHKVNRIRSVIRTEISKLTNQKPSASAVPSSSDLEDLSAAYAAEQAWEHIYYSAKVRSKFREVAFWMCITGTGFFKVYYDISRTVEGPKGPVNGDIVIENVSPFHLFVADLRETDIECQPFVLHSLPKTALEITQMYPEIDPKKLQPSEHATHELVTDTELGIVSNSAKPNTVMLHEIWVKPNVFSEVPNGGRFVVAANQLLDYEIDGMPYGSNFPFVRFPHIPTGKFYSASVITDIAPLQTEYNRTRSQIIEAKNKTSKPQLMAPKGSVQAAKITTEPGLVIEYMPGFNPPQPLPIQPLPAYVINELATTLTEFEDLSGQHQVTKGATPPGVTAATAIAFLQEQDDSFLSPTYAGIEEGMEMVAKRALELAVKYWDDPRLIKAVGSSSAFDVQVLRGAQLKNGTDIRMEGGSALPTSKAARQAFIMDMMSQGFISPEDGLKLLEMGGVRRLYDQIRIDESQAYRENLRMKQIDIALVEEHINQIVTAQQEAENDEMAPPALVSPIIPVNTWDNHEVHVKIHNNYRKTQEFELLPEHVKNEFEKHVLQHQIQMAPPPMMGGLGGMPGEEQPGLLEGTEYEVGPGGPPTGNPEAEITGGAPEPGF